MPVYDGEFRTSQGQPLPTGLNQVGPVIPIEIAIPTALSRFLAAQNQPIPSPIAGIALIDTGATRSCADRKVMSQLGVNPIGRVRLGTARGRSSHLLYPAKFRFPQIQFEVEYSSVVGVDLRGQGVGGTQIIALIGRDLLARCIFVYHGTTGSFSLAF